MDRLKRSFFFVLWSLSEGPSYLELKVSLAEWRTLHSRKVCHEWARDDGKEMWRLFWSSFFILLVCLLDDEKKGRGRNLCILNENLTVDILTEIMDKLKKNTVCEVWLHLTTTLI